MEAHYSTRSSEASIGRSESEKARDRLTSLAARQAIKHLLQRTAVTSLLLFSRPSSALSATDAEEAIGTARTVKIGVEILDTNGTIDPSIENDVKRMLNGADTPSGSIDYPPIPSVQKYYSLASYGQINLQFDVVGTFPGVFATEKSSCDVLQVEAEGDAEALRKGIDMSHYDKKIYVLADKNNLCPWPGVGQINGKVVVMNGEQKTQSYVHEIGHTFGLGHSGLRSCPETADVSCFQEYGDTTDPMGDDFYLTSGFNPPHEEQLGILSSDRILPVTESGTYTIEGSEEAQGPQVLKIRKPGLTADGKETYYYIDYTQLLLNDSLQAGGYPNMYNDPLGVHAFVSSGEGRTELFARKCRDCNLIEDQNNKIFVNTANTTDHSAEVVVYIGR